MMATFHLILLVGFIILSALGAVDRYQRARRRHAERKERKQAQRTPEVQPGWDNWELK